MTHYFNLNEDYTVDNERDYILDNVILVEKEYTAGCYKAAARDAIDTLELVQRDHYHGELTLQRLFDVIACLADECVGNLREDILSALELQEEVQYAW